jgi:4-cresol dehydrogenase (hydroxylating) flavoprotein subunit
LPHGVRRKCMGASSISELAKNEFAAALGDGACIDDPQILSAAETTTFDSRRRIPLILRPGSREEVQTCVRIANRHGVSLYAISSGKNWGYGSRVPTADGTALLDLGRLNRIVAYSEEHAYVTIEAGVTQRQLFAYLAERGSRLMMDCTGASPDCAVVGNTVERGFGHTPYGDHFAHICNLEVVLADGSFIETGYGSFRNIAATPTYRWGVGPILDGLFSQSNLGIVTRLTMFLMPQPEYFQAFFFSCTEASQLPRVIDALRPLRLDGTIRSACHIGNDYKVISGIQQFPWERTGGATPLTPDHMAGLRQELDFGVWNGSGGLYGTKGQVAEARRRVKSVLKGRVSKLRFLDDRTLALADRFAKPAKWLTGWDLSRTLELVRPVYGLMRGVPTDYPLRSVYWRKRSQAPADMDPDRDRCGLLWCAPVAPISGEHASRMSEIASRIMLEDGFEPMISITLLTERSLTCVISISYDRQVAGEDERALACFDRLVASFADSGYNFYRLGVQFMHSVHPDPAYTSLLSTLKRVLDPNSVLSPGRYDFAEAEMRTPVSTAPVE